MSECCFTVIPFTQCTDTDVVNIAVYDCVWMFSGFWRQWSSFHPNKSLQKVWKRMGFGVHACIFSGFAYSHGHALDWRTPGKKIGLERQFAVSSGLKYFSSDVPGQYAVFSKASRSLWDLSRFLFQGSFFALLNVLNLALTIVRLYVQAELHQVWGRRIKICSLFLWELAISRTFQACIIILCLLHCLLSPPENS